LSAGWKEWDDEREQNRQLFNVVQLRLTQYVGSTLQLQMDKCTSVRDVCFPTDLVNEMNSWFTIAGCFEIISCLSGKIRESISAA